jgi:hypothetical protein
VSLSTLYFKVSIEEREFTSCWNLGKLPYSVSSISSELSNKTP